MELITHSRMQAFKSCRKKHEYAYEIGLRPELDARALRMGSAHHAGLDTWRQTHDSDKAIEAVRAAYVNCPENFDVRDWEIERETMAALMSGYCWRWGNATHKVVASELPFSIPITNPGTGAKSQLWELAGKIDAIIELDDGRLAVEECKTVSEDLEIGSEYFRRLAIDHQVTIYVHAARHLGHDVSTVIWDCTRKPTIKPTAVPILDGDGLKIVLDANGIRVRNASKKAKKTCEICGGSGQDKRSAEARSQLNAVIPDCPCTFGSYRQTASAEEGYVLQSRDMTPEEWGAKLIEDIGERPQFYYSRIELPRLDDEIEEMKAELWSIQKTIREAQNTNRWFRTVSADTCKFCCYFGLCASKWTPRLGPPEGFAIVADKHPELGLDLATQLT